MMMFEFSILEKLRVKPSEAIKSCNMMGVELSEGVDGAGV